MHVHVVSSIPATRPTSRILWAVEVPTLPGPTTVTVVGSHARRSFPPSMASVGTHRRNPTDGVAFTATRFRSTSRQTGADILTFSTVPLYVGRLPAMATRPQTGTGRWGRLACFGRWRLLDRGAGWGQNDRHVHRQGGLRPRQSGAATSSAWRLDGGLQRSSISACSWPGAGKLLPPQVGQGSLELAASNVRLQPAQRRDTGRWTISSSRSTPGISRTR